MTTTQNESFDGIVLLWNTAADPSRAARLHAADCNMVNTAAKRRFHHIRRIDDDLADVVADLNERGYPVKRCKCCKEGRALCDVRDGDIYADDAGHDEMGKPL